MAKSPKYALSFAGTAASYATLGSVESLGLRGASFTAEAWVMLDHANGEDPIFGTASTRANEGLHLMVRRGRPYFGFFNNDSSAAVDLPVGAWVHLAWRYDSARREQALFVNGARVASSLDHAPFNGSGELRLGHALGNSYFKGQIAEARLWSRALADAEIADGVWRRAQGDEPGLTACWALDEGPNQRATPPRRDATLTGATWKESAPPVLPRGLETAPNGFALEFDGDGDRVELTDLKGRDFSSGLVVEAWVNPSGLQDDLARNPVISAHGPATGWELRCSTHGVGLLITLDGAHYEVNATLELSPDRWVHIAGVYVPGSGLRVLVNGALRAEQAVPNGKFSPFPNATRIGQNAFWDERAFSGWIAEVRLWQTPRTQTQILAEMFHDLPEQFGNGLIARWTLDAGTGTAVRDLAEGKFPGKVIDALWVDANMPPGVGSDSPVQSIDLDARVAAMVQEQQQQRAKRAQAAAQLATETATREEQERLTAVDETKLVGLRRQLEDEPARTEELAQLEHDLAELRTMLRALTEKNSEIPLATLVQRAGDQVEQARAQLIGGNYHYRIAAVELHLRALPVMGGEALSFPDKDKLLALSGGLANIDLEFGTDKPPEVLHRDLVDVPDVRGLTEAPARRQIAAAGLVVDAAYAAVPVRDDRPSDVGRIVNQVPLPGDRAPRASRLTIFIGSAS